jgi:hypothetical protein
MEISMFVVMATKTSKAIKLDSKKQKEKPKN